MKKQIKGITEDFLILILKIFYDGIIVLLFAVITEALKYILENWIYHQKLNEITNEAIFIAYSLSKYFVVTTFFLFVILHIGEQIKAIIIRLKK